MFKGTSKEVNKSVITKLGFKVFQGKYSIMLGLLLFVATMSNLSQNIIRTLIFVSLIYLVGMLFTITYRLLEISVYVIQKRVKEQFNQN